MSTSITYYTVYGVRLALNDEFIDEFHEGDFSGEQRIEPIYQSHFDPQFMVLGVDLAAMDKYGDHTMEEIDISTLPAREAEFREQFAEQYPAWTHLLEGEAFRLLCFNVFN